MIQLIFSDSAQTKFNSIPTHEQSHVKILSSYMRGNINPLFTVWAQTQVTHRIILIIMYSRRLHWITGIETPLEHPVHDIMKHCPLGSVLRSIQNHGPWVLRFWGWGFWGSGHCSVGENSLKTPQGTGPTQSQDFFLILWKVSGVYFSHQHAHLMFHFCGFFF